MDPIKLALYGAVLCLAVGFLDLASAGSSEEIPFEPGTDVVLPCQTTKTVALLEWKKTGIDSDYVFYYKDNRPYESLQNPSYQSRVKLVDQNTTGGKVSIVLSKTTPEDEGTYTCEVNMDAETKQTIHLKVKEEGNELGLKVGLPVGLLLLVAALIGGGFLYSRSKKSSSML